MLGGEESNHSAVKLGNSPETLVPEIYVIMANPLKCVAVLFRSSPEGNTTLSTITALHSTILHLTAPYFTVLYLTVLQCSTVHLNALYYNAMSRAELQKPW